MRPNENKMSYRCQRERGKLGVKVIQSSENVNARPVGVSSIACLGPSHCEPDGHLDKCFLLGLRWHNPDGVNLDIRGCTWFEAPLNKSFSCSSVEQCTACA